jgi:hypothetical protein
MPIIRANTLIVVASIFLFAAIVIVSASFGKPKAASPQKADGVAAWGQVYSVLISPRCINCHTASNYPEQGDNRARHFANVVRGPGGTGVAGFRCVTCHQKENADSTGVPGGKNWHLAPLSMKWQDLKFVARLLIARVTEV